MSFLPEPGYKRILVIAAYITIGIVGIRIFLKYLFKPFLPFLAAWFIAMLICPIINTVCRKTRIPRKIVTFFCVLLIFALIFGLTSVLCGRVISELKGIAENLMADASSSVGEIFDYFENLTVKIPFLAKLENRDAAEKIKEAAISTAENAVTSFSARIPMAVIDLASSLPSLLLFAVALITATFYIGSSVNKINASIVLLLPERSRNRIFEVKKKLMTTCVKFVTAYLILLIITFIQLLIGFFVLKVPYALTLSAVIALVDVLPVLGVGTVLVPWAVILFIQGNAYLAVGLLILFSIIWISRQIIEPKIVGQSVGLSPLVTLISMYVGYRVIGIAGLFVLPIAVIAAKGVLETVRGDPVAGSPS